MWSDFTNSDIYISEGRTTNSFNSGYQVIQDILEHNNIKSMITGHQDASPFTFLQNIPKKLLIDGFYVYPDLFYGNDGLDMINNSKPGEYNFNTNNISVFILSSAIIPKFLLVLPFGSPSRTEVISYGHLEFNVNQAMNDNITINILKYEFNKKEDEGLCINRNVKNCEKDLTPRNTNKSRKCIWENNVCYPVNYVKRINQKKFWQQNPKTIQTYTKNYKKLNINPDL